MKICYDKNILSQCRFLKWYNMSMLDAQFLTL